MYNAYHLMANYKNKIFTKTKKELTADYIEYIDKSNLEHKISLFHVTIAYGLNHYFINQKLILAGFSMAGENIEANSINEISKHCLENYQSRNHYRYRQVILR